MKPSVQDIIDAAQKALREKVAPVVEDQWAASALRSLDAILSHLHARVPVEGPMLYEDNLDLVEILSGLTADLAQKPGLDDAVKSFLAAAARLREIPYPSVDMLCDLNIQGRAVIDDLLILCIGNKKDEGAFGETHRKIRAYLDRHIERERSFYFPTFVGRPV